MSEPALSRGLGVACFIFGFGTSLAVACGDLCSCPQPPARPPESDALRIDLVSSSEPAASSPPAISAPVVSPPAISTAPGIEEGTLEITDTAVVLRYTSEGGQYEVSYQIGDEPYPD